jgi:hypothetical protein
LNGECVVDVTDHKALAARQARGCSLQGRLLDYVCSFRTRSDDLLCVFDIESCCR